MAFYKDAKFLSHENGGEYDLTHNCGAVVPYSGIYRCTGCGQSSTNVKGHVFPTQNHHQHHNHLPIKWQLAVKSHWI